MGSSPSKLKIQKLILESLKKEFDSNNAITRIEPRYKNEEEESGSFEQLENTNENEIDNLLDNSELMNKNNEMNNNKNYPQNCIGQIIFLKNGIEEKITGSIIGENFVLTLASLIYDYNNDKYVNNIKFIDSNNNKYKNPEIIIFRKYKEFHQKKDDLAILIFQEKISKYFLGIDLQEIENLPNLELNIFGYNIQNKLFHGTTNADSQEDNLINYEINLNEGEEGSPLIKILDNKFYIIGLHISSSDNKNIGNIFSEEIIQFIYDIKEKNRIFIDESLVIKLDFSGKNLSPFDMEFIKEFNFINLHTLNLSNNAIKTQGVYYLKQARLDNLKILILDLNEIGDNGIEYLYQGNYKFLTHLSLFCNNISKKGIEQLIKFDCKQSLIKLDLSENPKIGDNGILKFLSVNWVKLDTLYINKIKLSNVGLEYFTRSNIRKIIMYNNKIGNNALNIIQSLKLNNREIITGIPELDL